MKHGYICSIIRRIVLFSLLTLLLSAGASNAETLILPGDVDIIEAQAFMGDASIGIAVLPEGITEIRSEAFADSSITEINLPASLTYIAPDAFSGTGLQKVSAVKGSYAYDWACAHGYIKPETDAALFTYSAPRNDCVLITGFADPENAPAEIIIPEFSPDGYLITAIDEEAFEGCAGLTAVTIPANIEVIYDSAFRNCVSLENLVLTEGLRTIASTVNGTNGAFVGCTALESVAIPSTVAEIGNTTFYGCSALTTVVFRDSSEVRMTIGREAFSGTALSGALSVPAKVSAIGEAAFEGTPISALTIAEGEYLKAVGEAAFRNCEFLTAVTIPGNVETIGANAFTDCIALNDLSLAEGLKTFASTVNYTNGAFVGCTSLESVTIPSTVAEIGNTTFYGCSALTTVVFRDSSEVRMTIGREAFSGTALSGALSVPAKVSAIGEAAFEGTPISALTIAEGEYLKAVGEAAFSSCAYLTAVTIPGNVETIGANAFRECIALESLELSEGLITIADTVNYDNGAFSGCSSLPSVTIPSTVTYIGRYAFHNCSALESVTINNSPENVTIGKNAFTGCPGTPVYAN